MKKYITAFKPLLAAALLLSACSKKIKQQNYEIYSRHLQQHVKLTIISTPMPDEVGAYIDKALSDPYRIAFAVIDEQTNQVLGTTSFHDIVADIGRVEIGYTWYRQSAQRTHVNTVCKIMLLSHAFETLGCAVVGQRTDCLNTISQRAIERLGMKKDGVIRHHAKRKDGSVRDTVMYSMLSSEWASNKQRLLEKLTKTPTRSFG